MINDLIKDSCRRFGTDPLLVSALISTESAFNPNVVRYEPNYRYLYKVKELTKVVGCTEDTMIILQKTSWGLCQIMGGVAYELGLKNWATTLLDPEINISFGCEYLAKIIKAQNLTKVDEIYGAYNAGSVRRDCEGNFVNKKNVDRFMKAYENLRKLG